MLGLRSGYGDKRVKNLMDRCFLTSLTWIAIYDHSLHYLLLFEQNNEKATHKYIKATVVGSARVMSYEDIVEAQKQREIKDVATVSRGRRPKRKPTAQVLGKRSRGQDFK